MCSRLVRFTLLIVCVFSNLSYVLDEPIGTQVLVSSLDNSSDQELPCGAGITIAFETSDIPIIDNCATDELISGGQKVRSLSLSLSAEETTVHH
jgi:hypothetical protein